MSDSFECRGAVEFYTVAQTAERLQISRAAVYKLIQRGLISTAPIGPLKRVSARELERLAITNRK